MTELPPNLSFDHYTRMKEVSLQIVENDIANQYGVYERIEVEESPSKIRAVYRVDLASKIEYEASN